MLNQHLCDVQGIKFAELPIQEISNNEFAIISRLKCDEIVASSRGGRVTSSVENRIFVDVPKTSFRFATSVKLSASVYTCILVRTFIAHMLKRQCYSGRNNTLKLSGN